MTFLYSKQSSDQTLMQLLCNTTQEKNHLCKFTNVIFYYFFYYLFFLLYKNVLWSFIYWKNPGLGCYAHYEKVSKGRNEEKLTRVHAVPSGLSTEGGVVAILYLHLCSHTVGEDSILYKPVEVVWKSQTYAFFYIHGSLKKNRWKN